MSRARPTPAHLRRIAVAWLLALGLATVLGAAGAQAAAREHACCRGAPVRAEAPPAPCASLLPLACCDGTGLPAAPQHGSQLGDPALAGAALALEPPPQPPRPGFAEADASPRASPLQLSVVLRL